jgi:hypothetical protein
MKMQAMKIVHIGDLEPGNIFNLPDGYEVKKVELPEFVDSEGYVEVVGFGKMHKSNFPYYIITKND